jgi:hypothetical protein
VVEPTWAASRLIRSRSTSLAGSGVDERDVELVETSDGDGAESQPNDGFADGGMDTVGLRVRPRVRDAKHRARAGGIDAELQGPPMEGRRRPVFGHDVGDEALAGLELDRTRAMAVLLSSIGRRWRPEAAAMWYPSFRRSWIAHHGAPTSSRTCRSVVRSTSSMGSSEAIRSAIVAMSEMPSRRG